MYEDLPERCVTSFVRRHYLVGIHNLAGLGEQIRQPFLMYHETPKEINILLHLKYMDRNSFLKINIYIYMFFIVLKNACNNQF